jgi:hypothetical protein
VDGDDVELNNLHRQVQAISLSEQCVLIGNRWNIYAAIHQLANLQFIKGMFLDDVKIIQNVTHISNCLF